jgi:hypothetical protein
MLRLKQVSCSIYLGIHEGKLNRQQWVAPFDVQFIQPIEDSETARSDYF